MLRVENLSKTYADGTRALHKVSFEMQPGECVMVLGKSGSGKSTLLRCINRLVEPSEGRILFEDRDVTGADPNALRAVRRRIGMIFQDYNLVPRASVLTNVLAGKLGFTTSWAALFNHFPQEHVDEAFDKLERLGISEKADKQAAGLSGGQQQRVGIARALMQGPQLILADEPVSSLDPSTARTILEILKNINERDGVSLLVNMHQPDLAREYGRRILAMKNGELIFDGSPDSLTAAEIQNLYH